MSGGTCGWVCAKVDRFPTLATRATRLDYHIKRLRCYDVKLENEDNLDRVRRGSPHPMQGGCLEASPSFMPKSSRQS